MASALWILVVNTGYYEGGGGEQEILKGHCYPIPNSQS